MSEREGVAGTMSIIQSEDTAVAIVARQNQCMEAIVARWRVEYQS